MKKRILLAYFEQIQISLKIILKEFKDLAGPDKEAFQAFREQFKEVKKYIGKLRKEVKTEYKEHKNKTIKPKKTVIE